jgi:hypothetical protein
VVSCPGCGKQLRITPPEQPRTEKPKPRGPSASTPFMRRATAVRDVSEGPTYQRKPRETKKASPALIIGLVIGVVILGGILIYVGVSSSSKPEPKKKQAKQEKPEPVSAKEVQTDDKEKTSASEDEKTRKKPEEKPKKTRKKPEKETEDKKPSKPLKVKRVTPEFIYKHFIETGRGQEIWKEGLDRLRRAIKEGKPVYKQLLDLLLNEDLSVARSVNNVLIDLSGRSPGDAPRIYRDLEERKEAKKDWEEWLRNAGKIK